MSRTLNPTLQVWRQPTADGPGGFVTYDVPDINEDMSFLEMLDIVNDRLTVIDIPKQLLWQILPSADEIALLSHVRTGKDSSDPTKDAEYPVIFCNRLPAPGSSGASPVGTQSIVHLISLEARQPLLDALKTKPLDNNPVRFVSLATWSFSTLQHNKTFTRWLKEAWCPDAQRTDPGDRARRRSN